ncbi:MAG: succinate dehydrogenase, hydrophobic membrane anchor protein [Gammaproteobacteria bacterium]|nr:succinate dehydrogenase, hydrophobic membrane anchor protein [Gammaproteobacteria bacterium]MDP2141133.1 succinate dehydrogenase, hydrophobic membrane anchor protein [Gammaproteobacteria bacterium]MDP2349192.1 succinate dehydrogenase, hydrophobic membrane anchor protein [Gammaproteobacteria bacterium]
MVTNVTNFGRSGLYDWVIQRLTAVVLAVYFVFFLSYLLFNPDVNYQQWQALFSTTWMRIASLLALLAICAHAWIGLWTISTDYLTSDMIGAKATVIRFLFQTGCVVLMFIYLVWGIQILWGI